MRKRWIAWTVTGAVMLGVLIWLWWDNVSVMMSSVTVKSERLPENFSGFRVAQVSDLHNREFGDNNERLLELLSNAKPDMIAITGDLVSAFGTDIDAALRFASGAVRIAPCYYVIGNHEPGLEGFDQLMQGLKELGVTVLRNEKCVLTRAEQSITVAGMDEPGVSMEYPETVVRNALELLKSDTFTLLLSHHPEYFGLYAEAQMDVILSGHAHGGQFRLPFIGGLYAPGQGIFPKYTSGAYQQGNSTMVVSRGLGNSKFPVRLGNRPEVVLVTLEKEG